VIKLNIIIGSKNPTKILAVKDIFPGADVTSLDAASGVSPQPFSDEETKQGAVNRATRCMKSAPDTIGIGLEGGVMYVGHQLYLCNWGALVTPDEHIFTASGARIVLPAEIEAGLKDGKELGDMMDGYARKQEVRKKEGAIGIFTNNLVSRKDMFSHVVKLLRGQWEYWNLLS
jgi:inosine/xanthosine triphosphatase